MTSVGAGVDEVHILWTSEGMSCDGDTVSMTAGEGVEDWADWLWAQYSDRFSQAEEG